MGELNDRLLLAVSFGTSFEETREKTIGAIEEKLQERFPDWKVCRCFTSRMIRKKLLERDGLKIDSPEEALERAVETGVREVTVQPVYLMHGREHRRLMETLDRYKDCFEKLSVGRPLLSDERDFRVLAAAVGSHLPVPDQDTAVVLMGHGTPARGMQSTHCGGRFGESHEAAGQEGPTGSGSSVYRDKKTEPAAAGADIRDNAVFGLFQAALRTEGLGHCYIATVEGEPLLGEILPEILEGGFKKVILAPFMIVAGDHAVHDLAGDGEDSWKSIFERNGIGTEPVLRGIGEWEEVQDLFAVHAAEANLFGPDSGSGIPAVRA